MTDLSAIADHVLFLEYTCGCVRPVPVSHAMGRGCATLADVRRRYRCADHAAPVTAGDRWGRVVYQRPGDR